MGSQVSLTEMSQGGEKAIIEFAAPSTSILECDKRVKIGIMRHGNIKRRVQYRYPLPLHFKFEIICT